MMNLTTNRQDVDIPAICDIDDNMIDITRVEIKDTNDRYVVVPKLADAHKLLKEDEY